LTTEQYPRQREGARAAKSRIGKLLERAKEATDREEIAEHLPPSFFNRAVRRNMVRNRRRKTTFDWTDLDRVIPTPYGSRLIRKRRARNKVARAARRTNRG